MKRRSYQSNSRQIKAAQTRKAILDSAKVLFQNDGFELVTIDQIAKKANVSAPTVYAIFQSKRGILHALMDEALAPDQFDLLVQEVKEEPLAEKRAIMGAKIARQIYDAEKAQMELFRGVSSLSPELKKLEKKREERRYERQKETVQSLAKEGILAHSPAKTRDILWALTGRDLYRLLVMERGWSSHEYEKWLMGVLKKELLK